MVLRGRLKGTDQVGVRVGRVINKDKVAKHFQVEIDDGQVELSTREDLVDAEAALDGVYVTRTRPRRRQASRRAISRPRWDVRRSS
jgi:hypothetical protein